MIALLSLWLLAAAPDAPDIYDAALQRFVWASKLQLREEPVATAKSLGKLRINQPLTLQPGPPTPSGFVKVKTARGRLGFVAEAMIGDHVLTVAEANMLAGASAGAVRLSWRQRAAALTPQNAEVLKALQAAYTEMKDDVAAAAVSRQIAVNVMTSQVHFARSGLVLIGVEGIGESTLPLVTWYVLRADGQPAVVETATAAAKETWNECAGTELQTHTVPIGGELAMQKNPPASWSLPDPALAEPAMVAAIAIAKRRCPAGVKCDVRAVSSLRHGVLTSVRWNNEDVEMARMNQKELKAYQKKRAADQAVRDEEGVYTDDRTATVLRLLIKGADIVSEHSASETATYAKQAEWIRDVLGDAQPEVMYQGGDGLYLESLQGDVLLKLDGQACGC